MPDSPATIRVLLAEDHATVRQGLKLLIDAQPDMEVIAEAADGPTAIERAEQVNPDVIVMDVSMPGMNGLKAARAIRQRRPNAGIVSLSRYRDDAYLQELLHAGASAYVLKQSASSELLQAIRAVAAGGQYLDSAITERLTEVFAGPGLNRLRQGKPLITERETEVLRLIARGYSNKEIAVQLALSVKTVEVHKANAMRKLGFKGRIDIVNHAILQGWMQE